MAMTDEQKQSFDFARSVTLQLITVAVGMVTLGVTFWEKFKPTAAASGDWKWWLTWSWMLLTASVVCGFWAWLALTGQLGKPPKDGPDIYAAPVCLPSGLQILNFLLGLIFFVRFGSLAVGAAA